MNDNDKANITEAIITKDIIVFDNRIPLLLIDVN